MGIAVCEAEQEREPGRGWIRDRPNFDGRIQELVDAFQRVTRLARGRQGRGQRRRGEVFSTGVPKVPWSAIP
jgi:hypothetical protein